MGRYQVICALTGKLSQYITIHPG